MLQNSERKLLPLGSFPLPVMIWPRALYDETCYGSPLITVSTENPCIPPEAGGRHMTKFVAVSFLIEGLRLKCSLVCLVDSHQGEYEESISV